MTFEEYLADKKIDAVAFQQQEPERFRIWQQEFAQMHPNSFTSRNLYLINPIRRQYPLVQQAEAPATPASADKPRPVMMRPKPKMN